MAFSGVVGRQSRQVAAYQAIFPLGPELCAMVRMHAEGGDNKTELFFEGSEAHAALNKLRGDDSDPV